MDKMILHNDKRDFKLKLLSILDLKCFGLENKVPCIVQWFKQVEKRMAYMKNCHSGVTD